MAIISKHKNKSACLAFGDNYTKNFAKRRMLNNEVENFSCDRIEIMEFSERDLVEYSVVGINKKYVFFNDKDRINWEEDFID